MASNPHPVDLIDRFVREFSEAAGLPLDEPTYSERVKDFRRFMDEEFPWPVQAHETHRWADVTTFSDTHRRVFCWDCDLTFDDGPVERSYSEPLESQALIAEKKMKG